MGALISMIESRCTTVIPGLQPVAAVRSPCSRRTFEELDLVPSARQAYYAIDALCGKLQRADYGCVSAVSCGQRLGRFVINFGVLDALLLTVTRTVGFATGCTNRCNPSPVLKCRFNWAVI